ncbi:hypothetical protein [Actinomadura litoris]|uniref:hypothetical protein n=1 Tax=Actinomadura litoris TaxID=2678616 RepID=UPI001FA81263|nr:hypothetical protein [Actinomadura litoris]
MTAQAGPPELDQLLTEYAQAVREHQERVQRTYGDQVCDFCCHAPPLVSFPRKGGNVKVTVLDNGDTLTEVDVEPWLACKTCAPLVIKRQLHLIIERTMRLHPRYWTLNRPERRALRARYKALYRWLFGDLKAPEPLDPSLPALPTQVLQVGPCDHPIGECPSWCRGIQVEGK